MLQNQEQLMASGHRFSSIKRLFVIAEESKSEGGPLCWRAVRGSATRRTVQWWRQCYPVATLHKACAACTGTPQIYMAIAYTPTGTGVLLLVTDHWDDLLRCAYNHTLACYYY